MVKVEAITQFTLGRFNEITNLVRKSVEKEGMLFVGDTFECTKEMAEYLTGKNDRGNVVVKVIEVIPDKYEIPNNAKTTKIEKVGKNNKNKTSKKIS